MENVAAETISAVAATTINEAIVTAVSTAAAATFKATASPSGDLYPSTEATAYNDIEVNNPTSEAIEAGTLRPSPGAKVGKIVLDVFSDEMEALDAIPSGSTVTQKGQEQQQEEEEEETGQVLYSGGPEAGLTVWLDGKREGAEVKVVERSHPHFEFKISVETSVSRRTGVRKLGEANDTSTCVGAESNGEVDTIAASFSLRKPDIQEALERWIRSSQETEMALLPATADRKIDLTAGKALRKWVSTGRAPRRAHLTRWLLQRLELVRINSTTQGAGSADEGVVGRRAGEYHLRLLEVAKPSDDPMTCAEVGTEIVGAAATGARAGRGDQSNGGLVGEREDELKSEKCAGKTVARDIAIPPDSGGETHGGDAARRCLWEEEEENPHWELGSTSGTSASDVSASAALPPIPAKPAVGEPITPDAPPGNVVGGAMSEALEEIVHEVLDTSYTIRRSVSSRCPRREPLDDSARGSGRETRYPSLSHHSPYSPCWRSGQQQQQRVRNGGRGESISRSPSKAGGRNGEISLTKSAGPADDVIDVDIKNANGVPRAPSHRRGFFALDKSYAVTAPSAFFHGREKDRVDSAGTWGAKGFDEASGREKNQRQQRISSVGSKHGYCSNEGPSTERGPQGSRWRVLTGRRCMTATGHLERQIRDATNWGNDHGKRKSFLESCERELTEAEERRRRAEADANAAERAVAWRTAGMGGVGDVKAQVRTRAATQRVLDLTLIVERVRQEQQKRRVAAARASEQAIFCKQPFRERRGRSQKGACIGPRLPQMKHDSKPSRDPRIEMTTRDTFYWDENGRRYSRGGFERSSGADLTSGELGIALEAVRRVASACLEEGTDFRQPFVEMDADGDGRISLAELGAALRRAGARLGLSQVTALFRHFSRDGSVSSDPIARGDILWEFVDKRRLLDQWRKAGNSALPPWRRQGGLASPRYRIHADERALVTRLDFYRALEDAGVRVEGWEKEALVDRFEEENRSGKVNWRGFVSVMQAAELDESKVARDAITPPLYLPRNSRRSSPHWSADFNRRRDERREPYGYPWPQQPRQNPPRNNQNQRGKQRRDVDHAPGGSGIFEANHTWQPSGSTVPSATLRSEGLPPRTLIAGDTAKIRRRGSIGGRVSSAPLAKSSGSRKWTPVKEALREGGGRGVTTKVPLGGAAIDSAAEALRVLDDLLGDQIELEAFLEKEIDKRVAGTVTVG